MFTSVIDSHIHLDLYEEKDQLLLLSELNHYGIHKLVTVSNHLDSARTNLTLASKYATVEVACGFHPEQAIPMEQEIDDLRRFLGKHQNDFIAIGEVGLPYYLRKKNSQIQIEPYMEILEAFVIDAKQMDKPIVLHAVYDDAPLVCSLLEKHTVTKAHFHWFKGDFKTVERMIENGYFISITPDVLYKENVQRLVHTYPITQLMVETDGPWPFEGPFAGKTTHPNMIHQTVEKISALKRMALYDVYERIYKNTMAFYRITKSSN